MGADPEIPDAEIPEADPNLRYSLRILLEIESQQAQISAQTPAQTHRITAKSRSSNTGRRGKRPTPSAVEAASQAEPSVQVQEVAPSELPRHNPERDFHRREQMLRRRLELQKWHSKYSTMLIEASPEFRLGALLKKAAGDAEQMNVTELLARLSDPGSANTRDMGAEIEHILSEGEILKKLLPLLDPLPNI